MVFKANTFTKQSASLSKYSQMYPFSKPCIPEPDEGSLIQKTWDMPIETGYWLQVQLTSGQNHPGNVERRMSSWSLSFSSKCPLRLKGAEVSSVMIIDPRAIVDPAAGLAYSNSSLNGKVISQSSIQKKSHLCLPL